VKQERSNVRIALIADLHGNLPALQTLEQDLACKQPDEIWCLGDLVGKGPSSDITCDWVFERCSLILGGNWDYGIAHREFLRDSFYHEQLGQSRLDKLAALPTDHCMWLSGRHIRLIHGRPVMQELIHIHDSKERLLPLLAPDFDVLIYADCHRQGIRTIRGQIINTGSVGNGLGLPMVQYALLEGEPGQEMTSLDIRLVTLPYNNQAAAQDARRTRGLPDAHAYIHEVLTGEYAGKLRVKSERRTNEGGYHV
jgi:predicted phosphodiesterase